MEVVEPQALANRTMGEGGIRVPSTEYQAPRSAGSVVEMLLLQPAQQRRRMDPQDVRGLGLVLAAGGEHLGDVVLLQFAQGEELVAGG